MGTGSRYSSRPSPSVGRTVLAGPPYQGEDDQGEDGNREGGANKGRRHRAHGESTAPTDVPFNTSSPRHADERKSRLGHGRRSGRTTTGPIHVYTAAGQKTSATNYIVVTAPAPKITSFTPAFELAGTSVTITETNFSGTVSGEPHDERGEVQHHQRYDVQGELGDADSWPRFQRVRRWTRFASRQGRQQARPTSRWLTFIEERNADTEETLGR